MRIMPTKVARISNVLEEQVDGIVTGGLNWHLLIAHIITLRSARYFQNKASMFEWSEFASRWK